LILAVMRSADCAASPEVCTGTFHSCALHRDGTVHTWGWDGEGQLGTRSIYSAVPTRVSGLPPVKVIDFGEGYATSLTRDGHLWSWGNNTSGELGNGKDGASTIPLSANFGNIVAISSAASHGLAVTTDGAVWSWGSNNYGQLGVATTDSRQLAPVRVAGIGNVVSVVTSFGFSMALEADGTVWAWGNNEYGQLVDGSRISRTAPGRVSGLPSNIVAIAASTGYSVALASDGTVYTWGQDIYGQLGDNSGNSRPVPRVVEGLTQTVAIAAGNEFVLALTRTGEVWRTGRLDNVADPSDRRPQPVTGLPSRIVAISAGEHCLALDSTGSVWSWRQNDYGELGDGSTISRNVPQRIPSLNNIAAITARLSNSGAIDGDGTLWAWGNNKGGQIGDGQTTSRSTPITVEGLTDITAVAAGFGHTVALRTDGTVWAWGRNQEGQLGIDPGLLGVARSRPTQVSALSGVTSIAAGSLFTLALRSDGTVWAWGANFYGQLGTPNPHPDDHYPSSQVPTRIPGLSGVVRIVAGGGAVDHAMAITADGGLWAWGRNDFGQLGDGTSTTRSTPQRVNGLADVISAAAGTSHSVAATRSGSVWVWGNNDRRELSEGGPSKILMPFQVGRLEQVIQVAAGRNFNLALKRDGTVWAWGTSDAGELGDGTTIVRSSALPVTGLTDIVSISAANDQARAVKSDGTVWAWGWNSYGQLGDGTVAQRSTPVLVLADSGRGSVAGNDWVLDLDPTVPNRIPNDKVPGFPVVTVGAITDNEVSANIAFRPQDIGTTASVYVFALAPAGAVRDVSSKDASLACVLAQLDSDGLLKAVSASTLQSYVSGVLSSQGQAVTLLNGVPSTNIGGSTFFVGYGVNATAMLANGTNRGVLSTPGSVQCSPQSPQTGWWWNPAEDGRGFSIEVQGNHIFFASFLYDVSGRATWYVATGTTSLEGSLFQGDLLSARGGQALGGSYPGFPTLKSEGQITLAFNDATHGTIVWPGGTVPIQRFNIVPGGLNLPPQDNQPQSGWWWNPDESGRGFFLEWQGGVLDIAGYVYDDNGNAIWYLTENLVPSANPQQFSSSWWQFGNGMTLYGPWRQHQMLSDHVAPVTIQFDSLETATMALPNGRTTLLRRQRF
jgi:alpha-tubulin suppressor-like RCC1 family protein